MIRKHGMYALSNRQCLLSVGHSHAMLLTCSCWEEALRGAFAGPFPVKGVMHPTCCASLQQRIIQHDVLHCNRRSLQQRIIQHDVLHCSRGSLQQRIIQQVVLHCNRGSSNMLCLTATEDHCSRGSSNMLCFTATEDHPT